ncbi:MAG TPA: GAF domain-containing protein, partial [Roseiflexaceae bacterium]|nr:GAF domain-containing protein [Roseiflexaceae bacterium]
MSSQDVSDYQRLLAATDAIGEVARARNGQIFAALQHGLERLLAALDLPDGGLYTYSPHLRDLTLAAVSPADGAIARQGAQLALSSDRLPALAATAHTPASGAIRHQGSVAGDQAHSRLPAASLQSLALPLLAGGRLLGVLQVAGAPGQALGAAQRDLLSALADRLAGAIDYAQIANVTRSEQERTRALVDASNDAIMM